MNKLVPEPTLSRAPPRVQLSYSSGFKSELVNQLSDQGPGLRVEPDAPGKENNISAQSIQHQLHKVL